MIEGVCSCLSAGLPDGTVSYQKSQFWYKSEGLGMENVGFLWTFKKFYGYMVYFKYIWYKFDDLVSSVDVGYIFTILVFYTKKKSGNSASETTYYQRENKPTRQAYNVHTYLCTFKVPTSYNVSMYVHMYKVSK
jgi:hypothetical protein